MYLSNILKVRHPPQKKKKKMNNKPKQASHRRDYLKAIKHRVGHPG